MKTLKVSLKAIVFILATGLVLSSNSVAASEGGKININKSVVKNAHAAFKTLRSNESVVNVVSAGRFKNEPLIQLSFDNTSGKKILISMKDENGVTVYSEIFSGKNYTKTFLFENDLADANPVITVTYLGSNKTVKYLVSRNERTVSSMNITKL